MTTRLQHQVRFTSEAIYIGDRAETILCASLFYFRIPRELWADRMQKAKAAGYRCIDVYFPWNYHETAQGEWDFTGNKDIKAFLQLAAEEGLYVVARPGPYICSEWDGGALPSYLLAVEGLKLRDNCPLFLEQVARWYDQVLPMLAEFQLGEQGTVICVQLDNELDFYDCGDPHGYISALRDMALSRGIDVPLIACAGQGDLFKASGHADGVVPTCNFYPNDLEPAFETQVLHYENKLRQRNLPLMVTETNRSHFLLRRLIGAGAKLLGPYLQVSGTNFGFTNAANNWGDPSAMLTSDYDFGGMISPEGHLRPEARQGALLRKLLDMYGEALAKAKPLREHGYTIQAAEGQVSGPHALALEGGGMLLSLPNVSEQEAGCGLLHNGVAMLKQELVIGKGSCPLLPVELPLQAWGVDGALHYATAELIDVRAEGQATMFIFHSLAAAEMELSVDGVMAIDNESAVAEQTEDTIRLTFPASGPRHVQLTDRSGHHITISVLSAEEALMLADLNIAEGEPAERTVELDVRVARMAGGKPFFHPTVAKEDSLKQLERYGIYRGFAWYEGSFPENVAQAAEGLLLHDASDIVSVYNGDRYLGTYTPAGGYQYMGANVSPSLRIRSEIWGHTNFDDSRLPSLRQNALKGITGATAVQKRHDLRANWMHKQIKADEPYELYMKADFDDSDWNKSGWGSWFSADVPSVGCYRKEFISSSEANSWVLQFLGLQSEVIVYVNGVKAGAVNPLSPYMNITSYVQAGSKAQIACLLKRSYGSAAGSVSLYEGIQAAQWSISSGEEAELWQHATDNRESGVEASLPVSLEPGATAWLYSGLNDSNDDKGWRVYCEGKNMKLTVFFNGTVVGRLWTHHSKSRPRFSGGNQESFYLPGPWFKASGNRLAIMLEAVEVDEAGELSKLAFYPVS